MNDSYDETKISVILQSDETKCSGTKGIVAVILSCVDRDNAVNTFR